MALAVAEVVIKNVRVAALIRCVINCQPARHPCRRGNDGIVVRDGLLVVAVKIGHVNFAVAVAGLGLEGDFGLPDAVLVRDGLDDIVGERVRLLPQRRAGVAARQNRVLGETGDHPALHIAVVAAADLVLRGIRDDKVEALDVKVKFQNGRYFAVQAVQ